MAGLSAPGVRWTILAALAAGICACTAGPDYVRPAAPANAEFKELKDWQPARPAESVDRGRWWSIYGDAELDALESQVAIDNQTLKASEAAYRQAVALVLQARAGYFPTVSAGPGYSNRQTVSTATVVSSTGVPLGAGISTNNSTYSMQGTASWVPDFWGQVRRQVESDVAAAQASAAQLALARLTAQAQLATAYFELRYQDSLQQLLNETVAALRRSLQITENQYAVGVVARGDVITARTQLQTTLAQSTAVGIQRGQFEHAIALLIGKPPSALSIPAVPLTRTVPVIPVGLPSTLLERRPDIAQAERTMQQENALVGVQTAAYYPTITLSASLTYLGSSVAALESTSTRLWTLAASGSELAIDGGQRSAAVAGARAAYDESVANYRQTVLTAFQSVEDALVSLRILERQADDEASAVELAGLAVQIALNEYRAGTQPYTAVVTAQQIALADEQTALQIQESRLVASVALVQALGGGWDASQLPASSAINKGSTSPAPEAITKGNTKP